MYTVAGCKVNAVFLRCSRHRTRINAARPWKTQVTRW